jgi:hypothetical protein
MVGKVLGKALFTVAILSFTALASEESEPKVFGSDEEDVDMFSPTVEARVDNPIPELVANVGGEVKLLELDLGASFRTVVSDLRNRCSAQLGGFGVDFSEHKSDWESKLTLLEDCVIALSDAKTGYATASEQVARLREELVRITNNGFFSKIKFAITDTTFEETGVPLLNETMQCLWQARELLEWIIATNEPVVSVSILPEFCDYVARGANVVSRIVPTSSDAAQDASMFFWKITNGYGCYDCGMVVSDSLHRQKVEEVLGDFAQKGSMLKPFGTEATW